jgi:hypothetical protein
MPIARTVHLALQRWPSAHGVAKKTYHFWRDRHPAAAVPSTALHYTQICPHVIECDTELGASFGAVWQTYARAPAAEGDPVHADPIRLVHLFNLIAAANKLPAGDYIELGTFRGFTLRVIHKFMDPERTLYSLDTFEGFDQKDITVEDSLRAHAWKAGSFMPTSPEGVARYVGDGEWPQNLKVVKGWFPDSYKGLEDRRWRFVHIDFDLYQPIKTALEILWQQLLPGGVVMVHDYGCLGFPGARQAVDEFCTGVGILPIELGDRWGTAAFRKPA